MIYRIWINKGEKDMKHQWVVQPVESDPKQNPHNQLVTCAAVDIRVPCKLLSSMKPDAVPRGWVEVDGWLSLDGTTNEVVINGK